MSDEVNTQAQPSDTGKDAKLLKEIRERFTYACRAFKEIKDEAEIDMRYVTNQPWDPTDLMQRKGSGRPALCIPEIPQYLSQTKNQLRQNPRGIKIEPIGEGANDKSAEFRQNLIRGIEYDSNAQRNAYTPAFENCIERSYGFFRVTRKYVSGTDRQVCHLKGILNPDSVVYDPDYTEADWSDAMYCFVVEPIPWDKYKIRWPGAERKDFSTEDQTIAPDWIQSECVLVAEYWRVSMDKKGKRSIKLYITNGVEILEKQDELGSLLPIIPVIGREKYITEGGKTKRIIESMVRQARDAQMFYNYTWSNQAEAIKLIPKIPYLGYKGQFESARQAWTECTSVPYAFLEADVVIDGATGQILPLPVRQQMAGDLNSWEATKDSGRRAIQSAMGISPLPTAAQRQGEKSGVALEKIQNEQSVGTFDFTDNFDRALQLAGRVLLEWIPKVYTDERDVGVVSADGQRKVVKINTPQPYPDEKDPSVMQHYQVIDQDGEPVGDHGVTISTGPSYQSQREAASDFADTLIKELVPLSGVLPPMTLSKLISLAIKLRDIGPLGDQMSEIVAGDPQSQMAQGQQAMQQLQQAQQMLQELKAENQKLWMEKQAKVIEQQGNLAKAQMDNETKIAVAEISTKAQQMSERLEALSDLMQQFHSQAHDVGMQAQDHAQQQSLAQQQAQNAQVQQAGQQQHESSMAEQSQASAE